MLKSKWAYWEAKIHCSKSGSNTLEKTGIQFVLFWSAISASQAHVLQQFPKGLALVYEIHVIGETKMSKEEERPYIPITRNHVKSWKISHNFSYISNFEKIVLSYDINQCSLEENSNISLKLWIPQKNLNVNMKTWAHRKTLLNFMNVSKQNIKH